MSAVGASALPNKQLELTARHLGVVRPGRPRCGRASKSSRAATPRSVRGRFTGGRQLSCKPLGGRSRGRLARA